MRTDILKEMEISTQLLNADEVVFPRVVDIHPVNGRCNLNCAWCIGKKGYKKNNPLVDHFSIRGVDTIIENVLNPKYQKYWPLEFHICGCDSESLLKSKEIFDEALLKNFFNIDTCRRSELFLVTNS
ncbi:hypothetical protein ABQE22_06970 [Enterococcus durans]|uniref:hypothetical protein n=1 Tax=Enterococcus durans TaxID=53345 RepID=UPI001D142F02|nr:hypothetical protein [Enterococcus durans]MDB1654086.1 hypothetical protein [Enterococcus durans]MDB1654438.1 hypothetical protein [Enterococcus durans]MDB1664056.1 hypothetical protein [Enterococcus durans]MDB1668388.1 hypothetical protein [Enterococcus durans]MDB1671703.1 hypothetical protein [Enterococcus durans]